MMIDFVLTINLLLLCGNGKSRNNLLMTRLYAAEAHSTIHRSKPVRIGMLEHTSKGCEQPARRHATPHIITTTKDLSTAGHLIHSLCPRGEGNIEP